jgi:hypothetical protein
VLAVGLAAAGCGSVRMGAAAISGSQRIPSATLAAEVANLTTAYQADRKKIQISYPQTQMPRLVLSWMLRFRVRDELAHRAGVTVTAADSQLALRALAAQIKQQSTTATLAEVAVANGIPPDLISGLGRYQAIQTKLISRLDGGRLPTSTPGQQALQARFNHAQCLAAKSLAIQVNPQYGRLDYTQLSVVSASSGLSGVAAPSPSATAAPGLKPAC